jgi:hypothetical protein
MMPLRSDLGGAGTTFRDKESCVRCLCAFFSCAESDNYTYTATDAMDVLNQLPLLSMQLLLQSHYCYRYTAKCFLVKRIGSIKYTQLEGAGNYYI